MVNFPTSNPIGFVNGAWSTPYNNAPKKSIVQVYFPHRNMSWPYFNDKFDLKVGDAVYVDGKLQGYRGRVTEVSYSFKIKISDYKRVIAVIDTKVAGEFYFTDDYVITFDKNAMPFDKVLSDILEKHQNRYGNYFAVMGKYAFVNTVMKDNNSGKLTLEV